MRELIIESLRVLLGHRREVPALLALHEVVEALDPLLDRDEVREESAEPPLIDEVHSGALRFLGDRLLCLLLCADKEDLPAVGGQVPHEDVGLLDARQRLLKVDDVDPVPLHEDEALHLRVPAAGLMSEVDSGLEELLHRDDGHGVSPLFLRLRHHQGGPAGVRSTELRARSPLILAGCGCVTSLRGLSGARCVRIPRVLSRSSGSCPGYAGRPLSAPSPPLQLTFVRCGQVPGAPALRERPAAPCHPQPASRHPQPAPRHPQPAPRHPQPAPRHPQPGSIFCRSDAFLSLFHARHGSCGVTREKWRNMTKPEYRAAPLTGGRCSCPTMARVPRPASTGEREGMSGPSIGSSFRSPMPTSPRYPW